MEEQVALTLNRRLKLNWTAYLASEQLTDAAINEIRDNPAILEVPVLLRTLLAMLNLSPEAVAERSTMLKQLLKACSQNKNQWVPVVAGLVHRRLFPAGDPSIEGKTEQVLEETVNDILAGTTDDARFATDQEGTFYFQPTELRFLSGAPAAPENVHFVSHLKPPNFLDRERRLLEDKTAKKPNGQPARPRDGERDSTRPGPAPSSSAMTSSRGGLGGTGPLVGFRKSEKPLTMPGAGAKTNRPKVQELNMNMLVEMTKSVAGGARPKAATFGPKAARAAAAAATAGEKPVAPAKRQRTSAKSDAKPHLEAMAVPAPEAEAAAATTSIETPMDIPAPPAEQQPQPPEPQQPPAAPTTAAPQLDLEELFAQSPLMTEEDRAVVRAFFSDNWAASAPASQKYRVKLREDIVAGPDGAPCREALYLNLDYTTHNYKKTKKTKRLDSAAATS